jgi:hypothetical protein
MEHKYKPLYNKGSMRLLRVLPKQGVVRVVMLLISTAARPLHQRTTMYICEQKPLGR